MAKNRQGLPLHMPEDPPELSENLKGLEMLGVKMRRPTIYQIKAGKLNYYWTTGRIIMDGRKEVVGKGYEQFLLLLGLK